MKKLILSVLFAVAAIAGVYAQAGTKAIGFNASYGSEISNIGVGAELQYHYTDPVRFELGVDYFLKADYTTMWDVNFNLDYVFNVAPKVNIYPLIGLTYSNWKYDVGGAMGDFIDKVDGLDGINPDDYDDAKHFNRVGLNVGVGGEYFLLPNVALSFELKYQLIKDYNQVVFGAGIAYKFK